jgi:integrase
VFEYAVRHRYVEHNPVREVQKLRGTGECVKEIEALSPREINLLLEASGDDYRPLLMTAVLTGMRQGELLGLMWDDIDW